jgi:hydrogenase expression/formation protein HypE
VADGSPGIDLESWSCPLPLRDTERIVLGHGGGGRLSSELVEHLFLPAFGAAAEAATPTDAAVLAVGGLRLAFSTDTYVVRPLFFPGGNIGELAVNGTVNDLAVAGAEPLYLTAGFVIEEGFPLADLKTIVASMAAAAVKAGVKIVAGDTKVVNKGKADGIFINTSGIGVLPDKRWILASQIEPGDKVIISGELASHGVAVMAERNGLTFDPPVVSDTRALNSLVRNMYDVARDIHFMRDPTRGGLATTLKEIALESGKCIRIREQALPVVQGVKGACSLLGLDPLFVANEGILIAVVKSSDADAVLAVMKQHEHGRAAAEIGEVADAPSGAVLLETAIGGTRIIDMLQGEQLPRIC